MDEIDVSIQAVIVGTTGLASLGTPYYGLQDEHKVMPYLTFQDITGPQEDFISQKYLFSPRYTFSIFHTDKTALAALQRTLQSAFDRTPLTYDDPTLIPVSCDRVLSMMREHSRPDPDGQLVYQAISDYIITIDRTY